MPMGNNSEVLLFSGSSHPLLAEEIAKHLSVKLGRVAIGHFPDHEVSLQILENVRGRQTFIVQTIALDPNNYLMELLVMIDALKRASAQSITVLIPYFGYSRQDRKDRERVPITAKLVADLLSVAGADHVLTMDLHAGQIEGFFNIPVDNLHAMPYLAGAYAELGLDLKDLVVVAPDIGSIKLTHAYANRLGVEFAVIDKHRVTSTDVKAVTLIGDVTGKNVLLADDMCSTGGTLVSAAKACHEKGAKRIFAAVTHGLFLGDSVELIEKSPIEALFISNTIPYTERLAGSTKIKFVSIASLFAQAVHCIISQESISSLEKNVSSAAAKTPIYSGKK